MDKNDKREKLLKIITDSARKFEDNKKIELIGIYGSFFRKKDFEDIDMVVVAKKEVYDRFKQHLEDHLTQRGIRPYIFEAVWEKPKALPKGHLMMQIINYWDLNDIKNEEWKSLIHTIKHDTQVIYGNKHFLKKIPEYDLTKNEILSPVIKWANRIKSKEEYYHLSEYLKKIAPVLNNKYPLLNLDVVRLNELFQAKKWKSGLKEVIKVLGEK